jgi:hypothetical protein
VIAAFELDDPRPIRGCAREAQRRHRRLGARAHEAHHLDRRHHLSDRGCHLDLERGRRAERESGRELSLDRSDDGWMTMAEDHRAPGADVVEELVAVFVPQVRAVGARDEARRAAHRFVGAHRRVDATWQECQRFREQRLAGARP